MATAIGDSATVISSMQTAAAPPALEDVGQGHLLGAVVSILAGLAIWFAPLPMTPTAKHAMAISVFMVLGWITHAMEHALMGFIGCFLYWALGVVKLPDAFAGFSFSPTWFIFGATLIGAAASKTGLARRISHVILRIVGTTYSRILLGLIISDFVLTFFVPSGIARVVIMAAIAIGLLEAFGVQRGSNAGRGMFIILTYTASIFDKMIIAGAASILASGIMQKFGKINVYYSQWTLAFLPCALLTVLAAWRLVIWLYPSEVKELPEGKRYLQREKEKMGPWSAAEKRAAILMGIAIALWLTDFVNHIPAAMVGIGIGLLMTVPGIGALKFEDVRKLNYYPLFFAAHCLTLGHVLAVSGALKSLSAVMVPWLNLVVHSGNVFTSTVVLYFTAFIFHLPLGSELTILATTMPVMMQFALSHGLNPLAVGMIWNFASGGKLFVYQTAPLVMGYSFGYFSGKDMLKVGAALTLIEALLLVLLVPLYWPLIGIHW